MSGRRGGHVGSGVSVLTVPTAGTFAAAMGLAVVVAVAVMLAMAVELGEVLAEGRAVRSVGHVGLRS
jgi:hypothetical protein